MENNKAMSRFFLLSLVVICSYSGAVSANGFSSDGLGVVPTDAWSNAERSGISALVGGGSDGFSSSRVGIVPSGIWSRGEIVGISELSGDALGGSSPFGVGGARTGHLEHIRSPGIGQGLPSVELPPASIEPPSMVDWITNTNETRNPLNLTIILLNQEILRLEKKLSDIVKEKEILKNTNTQLKTQVNTLKISNEAFKAVIKLLKES